MDNREVATGTLIVRTVMGDLSSSMLGVTSSHEHVICNLTLNRSNRTKDDQSEVGQSGGLGNKSVPFEMGNLYWIRENQLEVSDNLVLADVDTATYELSRFRAAGGSSIIDVTCEGLGRDPLAVAEASRRSGVNVVLGSGFYVDATHPGLVAESSVEELASRIAQDVLQGIDGLSIRAGVIGEIGCSWPVTQREHKVLSAAAQAHRLTGAPVVVHPGRHRTAPISHVTELVAQGVDASKIIVAHVDRRLKALADILDLSATGCFLSFDCFGMEPWIAPETRDMPMPSDLERIQTVEDLFINGFGAQVLLGCDIAMKHRLTKYGGHGYDYLLRWVAPALLSRSSLTKQHLDQMLVANPKQAFAFTPISSGTIK